MGTFVTLLKYLAGEISIPRQRKKVKRTIVTQFRRDILHTCFHGEQIPSLSVQQDKWVSITSALSCIQGFPCGSAGKESTCNAGYLGSVPGLGRSPGEGKGYPLQYSGLENSMDRGVWQATVHGFAKSLIRLSFHFHIHSFQVFPGSSDGKGSACNERNVGSIPQLGRSPGEGKGYPLQYSGLESSMDCRVHGVAKSRTQVSD